MLITKVEEGKITFFDYKFNKEDKKIEKGEKEQTGTVNKDTEYFKAVGGGKKKKKEPEKISHSDLKKAVEDAVGADKGPKGVAATIEIEDGKVSKITTGGGGGKGKGKAKEDK